jgi:glucose 1-dehydrogenase
MTFAMLEGKVAIITGAAMGMGEATARLFAEAGAHVVVADFNEEAGSAVAASITESGGSALFHKVDISHPDQFDDLIKATVAAFGRLDVAVNNAALKPDSVALTEFDETYWDRLMSVDLKGTAISLKYEMNQMIAQGGGGSIVNISSINGFKPTVNQPAYIAAKHGVVGLTKAAAFEAGRNGIRVNSVAPGAIRTPMLDAALTDQGLTVQDILPSVSLLGRVGEPREVAQASLWLASDLSSYVTGTTLHVDGGFEIL